MAIVLGANQYGKAEVRMVYVDRSTPVHEITDVNVTSQLIGDFTETHLTGANDAVIATDTQKNTVYAMARTGGFTSPEEFALRLARNYVGKYEQVTGARMAVEHTPGTGSPPPPARTITPSPRVPPRRGPPLCARTVTPKSSSPD